MTNEQLAESYRLHCKTVWNFCNPLFMNVADTENAVRQCRYTFGAGVSSRTAAQTEKCGHGKLPRPHKYSDFQNVPHNRPRKQQHQHRDVECETAIAVVIFSVLQIMP